MNSPSQNRSLHRIALRKAALAAKKLSEAARLMREASEGSPDWTMGRGDFADWAKAMEELLSCDHGQAGIGPTLIMLSRRMQGPAIVEK